MNAFETQHPMKPDVLVLRADEVKPGDEIITWGIVFAASPQEDGRVQLRYSKDGTQGVPQGWTNVDCNTELAILRKHSDERGLSAG